MSNKSHILPVVLAGGEGTRLWPLSNSALPKPFLALYGKNLTLLEETLLRVANVSIFLPPLVLCNARHEKLAKEILLRSATPDGTVLTESESRNTAPAIAAACLHLRNSQRSDALVAFLPSDHHFKDADALAKLLPQGAPLAKSGHIVLFGAEIRHPATGYGYIRKGAQMKEAFEVTAFTEKPDAKTAETYAASGEYLWNCGIILSRIDTLLAAFANHFPAFAENPSADCLPAESIDVALLQKFQNAVVIPTGDGWADVGSWNDVWNTSDRCAEGNLVMGDAQVQASSNCLVVPYGNQRITLIGVQDLVIVATDGHILIADRKHTQQISQFRG